MDGSELPPQPLPQLIGRGVMGGLMMGLANLVPGISGGTMLLAAGVYPEFIGSIAKVTRLKFEMRALITLAVVGGSAVVSILLGAGLIKDLVLEHRWLMYSLFIGLTLGGVPVVWNLVGKPDFRVWSGAAVGFLGMALLAWLQASGVTGAGSDQASAVLLLFGGVAGASAMILPGVSGGYLLLVMGLYVPILSGLDALKEALKAADVSAMVDPVLTVVAPVGVGVVLGIALVSNGVQWCLKHQREATLGVLLGLLVGAVVGLYPFQEGRVPAVGEIVKGRPVTEERLADLDPEDYPVVWFAPSGGHIAGSIGMIAIGLCVTGAVAWLGRRKEET